MMSHGESWRAACASRMRDALAIGSSNWLGWEGKVRATRIYKQPENVLPSTQSYFLLSGEEYLPPKTRAVFGAALTRSSNSPEPDGRANSWRPTALSHRSAAYQRGQESCEPGDSNTEANSHNN